MERPRGYGRIVRRGGAFVRVVEEADATPAQRTVREINSGIYAFDLAPLFAALREVPEAGPKHERYLPGILHAYRRQGLGVETVPAENPDEIRGINSQSELAEAGILMRQRKNEELMAAGVTIVDPATAYIDVDVDVGPDTVIHPGVILEGRTRIGARCELHSGARIVDSDPRRRRHRQQPLGHPGLRDRRRARASAPSRTCGPAPPSASRRGWATSSSSRRPPWAPAPRPDI